MEGEIRKVIQAALNELGTQHRIDAYAITFTVEATDLAHGDYATNVAMVGAKLFGTNPKYLAGDLLPRIKDKLGETAASVEIAGPGFINITLAPQKVREIISGTNRDEWGNGQENTGKRVMIEYSNPNPFKELHIGHLMSNVVGESLSRLMQASGAEVLRDTFGGDVGPHVAKALWALIRDGVTDIGSVKEIGKAYNHGSIAYEESETAKAEIDALNTRIYDVVAKQEDANSLSEDDRALLALWRKGREVSMEAFGRLFEILGTKFDYTLFDSDTTEIGMRIVHDGVASGVFEESEGAIIYRGEKKGLHTLVFITSRGTPTYETKDIGLAFLKEERVQTDEVIIVTAIEQASHFKVFLAALEDIAPLLAKKTKHVAHGLLRLTTGKMSSRKGNIITAQEFIEEVAEKAGEKNPDPLIAQQVAIGAVKYMILRQSPGSDIVFDPEKSLSLDGDSGPYLQYALVRARSVLAQAGEKVAYASLEQDVPATPFAIERRLTHFPEVVARAARERAPNQLVQYLTELAGEWNSFYARERIIGGEHESFKLALAQAFVRTMANGLNLLGIPAPEKM